MRLQSPLGNLCEVLNQVKDSANKYKSTLSQNEAATRAVLIDPILRALGWSTSNTHMVEVEKSFEQVRADYVLNDINGDTRIIIEAKALGTNLNQKNLLFGIVNYVYRFQLEDIFLTDGLIWEHFKEFNPKELKPTRVLNIIDDDSVDCAAYFVQHLDAAKFWPIEEDIDDFSQSIEELKSNVSTLQKEILDLKTLLWRDPVASEKQAKELNFVPLSNLEEIAGKKPTHYKLPDGSILSIKNWKDVLRESCKFVLNHNSSISIPLPDRVGRKISLISYDKPQKGLSYISEEYNNKPIYIYMNYDSNNCVKNAEYILTFVPNSIKTHQPAVVLESE
jgi:hypothetical protein